MKYKTLSLIALLPILVVIILAAAGIILDHWVYIILGIACPLVAGVIWLIYKDTAKKGTFA